MRDPNWVPPYIREQQFQKSVKRTATIIVCLAVGVPFTLIAWTKGSTVLVILIPIILLVIGTLILRSGGISNRQFVQDYQSELQRKTSKPPSQ